MTDEPRPLSDKQAFEEMISDLCDLDRASGREATEEAHRQDIAQLLTKAENARKNAPRYQVADSPTPPQVPEWLTVTERRLSYKDLLLRQRIKLLLSIPAWREWLVGSVNPAASLGQMGAAARRAVDAHYNRVVEASNKEFGHWADQPLRMDNDPAMTWIMPGRGETPKR